MKKDKQSNIFYGLLVFLCLISIWLKIPLVGFLFLGAVFLCQVRFFRSWVLAAKKIELGFLSYFFIIAFYVVGLSVVYYLFGLSRLSVSVFLFLLSVIHLFLRTGRSFLRPVKNINWLSWFKDAKHLSAFVGLLFLSLCLALTPITDGSSTPWSIVPWPAFILFAAVSLILLSDIFSASRRELFFASLAYLFFIVAIVPLRYVLSFGYDTLIHQGALAQIAASGQVRPLTPFYAGQYSLEILINFTSGLPFVLIERWLVPAFFVFFIALAGRHLLDSFGFKKNFFIVPLTALLFLPTVFYYSSPYALSLVFSLAAIAFIYSYIVNRKGEFYWAALALALAATLIHPFVGLNVLIAAWLAKKFSLSSEKKKGVLLWILFAAISLVVVLAFLGYNWVCGKVVYLADPTYYLNNFLNIFGSPSWYVFNHPSWWLSLIYVYEKLSIFLVFALAYFFVFRSKKDNSAGAFIFVLALGAFVSAWLFVSGIEVEGYSTGDQANYSFRLLASAKWFLLFPVLLCLDSLLHFLTSKHQAIKMAVIIALAVLLTMSLYLTYPRNDDISRLGVNNIRAIDYQIIDTIRQREGGKDGYLVFANQLFGGAAIQKYGFGPYYQSPWGDLFYYSTPMASENNKRFNRIMDEENFDSELIYETLRETGLKRAYLITTDYWRPNFLVEAQISLAAEETIEMGEGNFIYLFYLK